MIPKSKMRLSKTQKQKKTECISFGILNVGCRGELSDENGTDR